jgi:hypothetical protein
LLSCEGPKETPPLAKRPRVLEVKLASVLLSLRKKQKCLNAVLKTLLGDIYRHGTDSITCHSLRSAIPTALQEAPNTATASDIKEWGRWKSTSSEAYTKLHRKHKKALFDTVSVALTM